MKMGGLHTYGGFPMSVLKYVSKRLPKMTSADLCRFLRSAFVYRPAKITGLVLLCLSLCSCTGKKEELLYITAEPASEEELPYEEPVTEPTTEALPVVTTINAPSQVYVDVAGAVRYPGVYVLSEGRRVFEAIDAAGGFTADASPASLNQAVPVYDGEQIYVPTLEEAAERSFASAPFPEEPSSPDAQANPTPGGSIHTPGGNESAGITADGKVNINCADEKELSTLYGIGQTRARAIIEYRTANGPFLAVEDLMKISGIKQGIFSKIKDQIII